MDVAVIGPGNWGTSLLAALPQAGISVRETVGRTRRGGVVTMQHARLDAKILWLCVPDRVVADTAKAIADRRRVLGLHLAGQTVVHSSGALTVDALDAARQAGAEVASVHPVMSFPTRKAVSLSGVLFGVEAEERVRRRLFPLLRKLGGKPFRVWPEKKALYHAAGTMASPLLVSELAAAIEMARLAGLSQRQAEEWVGALAQATVRNVFARGVKKSFSGPIARGDTSTISLHLQALAGHPILTEVYRSLALYALESLPAARPDELKSILRDAGRKTKSRVRH